MSDIVLWLLIRRWASVAGITVVGVAAGMFIGLLFTGQNCLR